MNLLFNHFADFVFYVFALGILGSCLIVVFAKNTIYAALGLITVFFNASVLLILMGAEFIGLILLFVYVGAVAILFLFAMMMTSSLKIEDFKLKLPEKIVLYGTGVVLAGQLCLLLLLKLDTFSQQFLHSHSIDILKAQALGDVLYTDYFLIVQLVGFVLFISMVGVIALLSSGRNLLSPHKISIFANPGHERITLHNISSHQGTKDQNAGPLP